MRISRNVSRHMGPGGKKCHCCFPAPGSTERRQIFRAAKRRDRREAIRDQLENH